MKNTNSKTTGYIRTTCCPNCINKIDYSTPMNQFIATVTCSCGHTFSAPQKRGRKPGSKNKSTKMSKNPNVVRYVNLECVDRAKNHDKFFDIFVMIDNSVITVNGRNGTTGTVRPYKFSSAMVADRWAQNKENEKIVNGYRVRSLVRPRTSPPVYNTQPTKKLEFDPQDTSDPILAQVIIDILNNYEVKDLPKNKKIEKVQKELNTLGMTEDKTVRTDPLEAANHAVE